MVDVKGSGGLVGSAPTPGAGGVLAGAPPGFQFDKDSSFRQILVDELRQAVNDLISLTSVMDTAVPATSPRCILVCLCIERCLSHGLRRGSLLKGDRELYEVIKQATSESRNSLWLKHDFKGVERLSHSSKGKARAWIRQCLNQRHLDDNINEIANRDKLVAASFEQFAIFNVEHAIRSVAQICKKLKDVKFDLDPKDPHLNDDTFWETAPDVYRTTNKLAPAIAKRRVKKSKKSKRRKDRDKDRGKVKVGSARRALRKELTEGKTDSDSESSSQSSSSRSLPGSSSAGVGPTSGGLYQPSGTFADIKGVPTSSKPIPVPKSPNSPRHARKMPIAVGSAPAKTTPGFESRVSSKSDHRLRESQDEVKKLKEELKRAEEKLRRTESEKHIRTKRSPEDDRPGLPRAKTSRQSRSRRGSKTRKKKKKSSQPQRQEEAGAVPSQLQQQAQASAPTPIAGAAPVGGIGIHDGPTLRTMNVLHKDALPAVSAGIPIVARPRGPMLPKIDLNPDSFTDETASPFRPASPSDTQFRDRPHYDVTSPSKEEKAIGQELLAHPDNGLSMFPDLEEDEDDDDDDDIDEFSPTGIGGSGTEVIRSAANAEQKSDGERSDRQGSESGSSLYDDSDVADPGIDGDLPTNPLDIGPVDEFGRPLDLYNPTSSAAITGAVLDVSHQTEGGPSEDEDDDDMPPLEEEEKDHFTDLPHLEPVYDNVANGRFVPSDTSSKTPINIPFEEREFDVVRVSTFGKSKRTIRLTTHGISHVNTDSFYPYKEITLVNNPKFDRLTIVYANKREITYKTHSASEIRAILAERLMRFETGVITGSIAPSARESLDMHSDFIVVHSPGSTHTSSSSDGSDTQSMSVSVCIKPSATHHPTMRSYRQHLDSVSQTYDVDVFPGAPPEQPELKVDDSQDAVEHSLAMSEHFDLGTMHSTMSDLDGIGGIGGLGPVLGHDGELQHYLIASYFEPQNKLRESEKHRFDELVKDRVKREVQRLRNRDRVKRRDKPPARGTIDLDLADKTQNRSQLDIQGKKCYSCDHRIAARGGGARYCEYTGKMYCSRCHYGESTYIPAKILRYLDVGKYPVCKSACKYLDRIYEMPEVPRSMIKNKVYFASKPMQQFAHLQLQLSCIAQYIEKCPQQNELLVRLGTRQYLLYEDDLLSVRDLVEIVGEHHVLLKDLRSAVAYFEKHVTQECDACGKSGILCEYCKDPIPIFNFQIPYVLNCSGCNAMYHTKCYEQSTCPECVRREKNHSTNHLPPNSTSSKQSQINILTSKSRPNNTKTSSQMIKGFFNDNQSGGGSFSSTVSGSTSSSVDKKKGVATANVRQKVT